MVVPFVVIAAAGLLVVILALAGVAIFLFGRRRDDD
jgi:hypothetical protein